MSCCARGNGNVRRSADTARKAGGRARASAGERGAHTRTTNFVVVAELLPGKNIALGVNADVFAVHDLRVAVRLGVERECGARGQRARA